ncbi:unnamed protein product [Prorocentrum cordatum]|uniref:Apple domain-containing protein n=1 Tax=Prorocentrum cordatum TaxID=2364126 RepID=A0ABN9QVU8_9DINO|nr:unnamed protein product [Polarella glacialis]
MARASLLVAFSLLALAAGDDESCSSGAEEAALLQTGNSQGKSIAAHAARAGSSCAPALPGKNNDASSCEQLCGSTGGCQGWTFIQSKQTPTKQCWLKDANLYCPAQDNTDQYNTTTAAATWAARLAPAIRETHRAASSSAAARAGARGGPSSSPSRRPRSSAGSRMRTCTALPRTTPTSTTRTPPATAAARAGEPRVVVCKWHAECSEPSAVRFLCGTRLLSASRLFFFSVCF